MSKKMISASILCILILTNAFSQTEKFDIATFIPPTGWQRIDSNGIVAFLDSTTTDGLTGFCQIILYPSSSGMGNANKNFNTAWQNLVAKPNNESATTQFIMNKAVSMNEYDFTMPDKWQLQENKDHLLIQNMGSGCLIRILEPQPSSGDLEKDAKAVFEMMYAGWQYQKTGDQQYVLSKGFLPKGLEYYMMEASMSMTSADGRYHLEEGAALVIKAGNQIVIISVRHNSSMLAHGDCHRNYNTWRRFFNSFTVKNALVPKSNEEDVSIRITGAWSQTESGASSEYIFAANGNYAFNGAIGTSYTTSHYNYEYLHIKTYAFQGEGNYSINANQLTLRKHSTNDTEQVRFRFEKVNHGGTGWKDRLNLLKNDAAGENEVCYEKRNQ